MDLTVRSVCQRQIQIIIPMCCVLSVIDNIPFINGSLTAFKVPEYLGTLADVQLYGCAGLGTHIQRCGNSTCEIRRLLVLRHSKKLQTAEQPESRVGRSKGHIIGTKTDLICNAVNSCRSLYGNLCSPTERNGNNGLIKRKGIGSCDGNDLFTDNIAAVYHLSSYGTFGTVGNEYAVGDGTHSCFLDSPLGISGDINLGTNSIGTESAKGNGATRGVEVVIGGNSRTCKLTICGCGGDYKESIGSRSFTTVGQRAVDLQILTGTLRTEGGGSAAVAVSGDNATHLDHVLSHFIFSETGRIGCLTAIGNCQNKTAVFSYTNKGAGITTCMAFGFLVYRITVCIRLNQIGKQNGDSLLFPTGKRVRSITDPYLGNICRSGFSRKGMLVVVNDRDGRYAAAI